VELDWGSISRFAGTRKIHKAMARHDLEPLPEYSPKSDYANRIQLAKIRGALSSPEKLAEILKIDKESPSTRAGDAKYLDESDISLLAKIHLEATEHKTTKSQLDSVSAELNKLKGAYEEQSREKQRVEDQVAKLNAVISSVRESANLQKAIIEEQDQKNVTLEKDKDDLNNKLRQWNQVFDEGQSAHRNSLILLQSQGTMLRRFFIVMLVVLTSLPGLSLVRYSLLSNKIAEAGGSEKVLDLLSKLRDKPSVYGDIDSWPSRFIEMSQSWQLAVNAGLAMAGTEKLTGLSEEAKKLADDLREVKTKLAEKSVQCDKAVEKANACEASMREARSENEKLKEGKMPALNVPILSKEQLADPVLSALKFLSMSSGERAENDVWWCSLQGASLNLPTLSSSVIQSQSMDFWNRFEVGVALLAENGRFAKRRAQFFCTSSDASIKAHLDRLKHAKSNLQVVYPNLAELLTDQWSETKDYTTLDHPTGWTIPAEASLEAGKLVVGIAFLEEL
jgi:predicted  nucleic acid-binding Zn-ribbon protein